MEGIAVLDQVMLLLKEDILIVNTITEAKAHFSALARERDHHIVPLHSLV